MDKKKLNKKDFRFRKIENETLIKVPGQINGIDFNIRFLKNCTVYLCDRIATIYVDDCENCTFYVGPVVGSIFMRDCKDCSLSVAAAQVRISKSTNIKLYSFCQSDPTLEQVSGLEVAPYNFLYPMIAQHFSEANLDAENDRWNQVADFTKNEDDSNWKVMAPENWPGMHVKEIDGVEGSIDLPTRLPSAYGGDLEVDIYARHELEEEENPGGIKSFAIGTDEQLAWDAVLNEQQTGLIEQEEEQNINDFLGGGETDTFGDSNTFLNSNMNSELLEEELNLLNQTSPMNLAANSFNQSQSQATISQNEEDPLVAKVRAREAERQELLQKMYQEEVEQKRQRRLEAQQYLQEYMSNHQQSLLDKRSANQLNNSNRKTTLEHGQSWQLIKNNIALRAGDYPGTQDITRMRESILNKADDGTD